MYLQRVEACDHFAVSGDLYVLARMSISTIFGGTLARTSLKFPAHLQATPQLISVRARRNSLKHICMSSGDNLARPVLNAAQHHFGSAHLKLLSLQCLTEMLQPTGEHTALTTCDTVLIAITGVPVSGKLIPVGLKHIFG